MIRGLIKTDVFKEDQYLYLKFVESRTTGVYYLTRREAEADEYGEYLCDLEHFQKRWRIRLRGGEILPESIQRMGFNEREDAAQFYLAFKLNVAEETAKHPLPEDVTNYIERRSRDIREEAKDLSDRLHSVVMEQRSLRYLAEQYNLQRVMWETEEADDKEAVKDLLEFKIGDVPFFSEAYLYDAIGKEDARTVLALVRNLVRLVDPAQQFGV